MARLCRGRVTVEDDGFVRFQPEANGLHRYLIATPEQIVRVQEALVMLTSQPPCCKGSTITTRR